MSKKSKSKSTPTPPAEPVATEPTVAAAPVAAETPTLDPNGPTDIQPGTIADPAAHEAATAAGTIAEIDPATPVEETETAIVDPGLDQTAEKVDETSAAPVTIDDVLADLATRDRTHAALVRRPMPYLSPEQAKTQSAVFHALQARGVPLRRQHDVYGWLLDQVAAAAAK